MRLQHNICSDGPLPDSCTAANLGTFNGTILMTPNLCQRRRAPFRIVDSCRTICPVTMPNGAYWVLPIKGGPHAAQSSKPCSTKSQAACLIALRKGKVSKPEIAIQAKLDLIKTARALGTLARLRLAKQDQAKRWHTTTRGKTFRFKIIPDRLRRNRRIPGPGGRRLLKLLDRPMRGNEIVERLGLVIKESASS